MYSSTLFTIALFLLSTQQEVLSQENDALAPNQHSSFESHSRRAEGLKKKSRAASHHSHSKSKGSTSSNGSKVGTQNATTFPVSNNGTYPSNLSNYTLPSTSANETVISDSVNSTSSISPNISVNNLEKKASTSTSVASLGLLSTNLLKNGVYYGFLPDEGDAGGTRQTMAQLNSVLGAKSAGYGWYAQAKSGTTFDGSQLLSVLNDVKACNCVFQPAVMPTGGWKGLTSSDNSQAVAIANVMKKFTDQGIPVWLRFAHEMNWYQTDGTYSGNVADFQAGWAAVAAAVKKIAPQVKMWWTPNVADAASYAKYAPTDMSTVDLVGIDYYPKSLSTGSEFITTMKSFHDKYAVNGRMFAIGETGLGWAGSDNDKASWMKQIIAAKASLPNMIASSWFNFEKEYDYRIVVPGGSSLTTTIKSLLV